MATLPTLLVNGNSVLGLRDWASQDYLNIDEAIASADGLTCGHGANATGGVDSSFLLDDMPSDFGFMATLNFRIRHRQASSFINSRWFYVRILRESDDTLLAANNSGGGWMLGAAVLSTSFTNTAEIAFLYLNTAANKAAWDNARVEIRISTNKNMGGDTHQAQLDSIELTGTYDVYVAPSTKAIVCS